MPISVLILGVFIIFLNFQIGKSTFCEFKLKTTILNIISIAAFLLLIVKPFNINSTIYISLGGFIILSSLAIYFVLSLKNKKELYSFFTTFLGLFGAIFLLNLFLPFLVQELFDIKTIIVALILGIFTFSVNKNLKISYASVFLTFPLVSLITFLLEKNTHSFATMLLGTGNLFEISFISFATIYFATCIKNVYLQIFSFHKKRVPAKDNNKLTIGDN